MRHVKQYSDKFLFPLVIRLEEASYLWKTRLVVESLLKVSKQLLMQRCLSTQQDHFHHSYRLFANRTRSQTWPVKIIVLTCHLVPTSGSHICYEAQFKHRLTP